MTEIDLSRKQEINSFPVIVKESGKLKLSKEIWDLLIEVWLDAFELLDWVEWHDKSYWEWLDVAANYDIEIYSNNVVAFFLENKRLVLESLEK